MRLAPKSLAGRLAAMLVLTLLVAQMVSFGLFAGERVSAFYQSYREEMIGRLVALVDLLEETPADLSDRVLATMNSAVFRAAIAPEPSLEASAAGMGELRSQNRHGAGQATGGRARFGLEQALALSPSLGGGRGRTGRRGCGRGRE